MPEIGIPSARIGIRFGKKKQRSQMCEIYTDDGRLVLIELDVLRSCVDDPATGQGFLLDADDQFWDPKDGQWHQILYEHSCIPITMIGEPIAKEEELKQVLKQIFHETCQAAKMQQYLIAAKNVFMERLMWIVAIVCTAAVILGGLNFIGGLHK